MNWDDVRWVCTVVAWLGLLWILHKENKKVADKLTAMKKLNSHLIRDGMNVRLRERRGAKDDKNS